MDIRSFNTTTTGEKINIFEYELEVFEQFFLDNVFILLQSGIVLIVSSLYLLSINPFIFLSIVTSSLIVPIIVSVAGQKIDQLTEKNSELKNKYIYDLKEIFCGFSTIKSFGAGEKFKNNFISKLKNMEENNKKLMIMNVQLSQILGISQYMIVIVCFCVGGWLVMHKNITRWELIAVTQISNMVIQPIQEIGSGLLEIKGSRTIREDLEKYILSPDIKVADSTSKIDKISIRNINYTVQGESILEDINLEFEKGKRYAVVGHSGSGKTSLLNIIGLLINDFEGELLINNEDISKVNKKYLPQIGHVFQETYLFQGSLKSNLTMHHDYAETELIKAIIFSELIDLFHIEKSVSEEGKNFSGGEKQRLSLARSLLKNPSVLLLDEFTAALDSLMTERLMSKITSLQNKIIILIMHDLQEKFLLQIDEIICLFNGRVIEKGSFDELIARQGYFWQLYNKNEESTDERNLTNP